MNALAFQQSTNVFDPKGPGAENIAYLGIFLFVVAAVVYIVVMGLVLVAVFRNRDRPRTVETPPFTTPPRSTSTFIVISGIVIPLIILMIVFALTLHTMNTLAAPDDENAYLTIEVIGRQWWWEVRYPEQGFETANEIHIPAGQPVRIRLSSRDVIHSFWVPELHGKTDLIPGRTNTIWIEADEPGAYLGECAEYCGLQHAHMAFFVVAETEQDFAAWVQKEQQPAPEPANDVTFKGQQVFLGSACVYCHAIQGTNANSDLGPDLTHFASRRTVGAGAVPNTRGHLAGWIIDSQSIKPGNYMPPMYLESEDLNALLDYMETLQ